MFQFYISTIQLEEIRIQGYYDNDVMYEFQFQFSTIQINIKNKGEIEQIETSQSLNHRDYLL